MHLLASEGHSYVWINEDGPVSDIGHLSHDPCIHGGQTVGLVDPDTEPSPRTLRGHPTRKQQVPTTHQQTQNLFSQAQTLS